MSNRYNETIEFLFNQLPVFEKTGDSAYKPGLDTVRKLSSMFGSPELAIPGMIHVAGTNGKGSTSHTLAAILQSAGYRVGLFTSPHLIDFRERIRVNGQMISEEAVIDFTDRFRAIRSNISPSFFELSTIMAFEHFAREKVDIAIIEVGLGGRLDSTNIITPDLSIITNISNDHNSLLGDTLEDIAKEKAGIIKPGVPVIIGEDSSENVVKTFKNKATECEAKIIFAEHSPEIRSVQRNGHELIYETKSFGTVMGNLTGDYQIHNANTVLVALSEFIKDRWNVSVDAIKTGFKNVVQLTGISGRWMKLNDTPLSVCDTGHNPGGWDYLSKQIADQNGKKHIIIGFVADKDVHSILKSLSETNTDAEYYFTAPHSHRRLDETALKEMALSYNLIGETYNDVRMAYKNALAKADKGDFIFVGGSNYVLSELLQKE